MNGYISFGKPLINGAFRNGGSINTVLSGVFRGQNDSGVRGQFPLTQRSQAIPVNLKAKGKKGA